MSDPDIQPDAAHTPPVCAVTLYLLPDGSAKWECHAATEGTQRDADENDARRLCREVGDYLAAKATAGLVLQMQAAGLQIARAAQANGNGKKSRLHLPGFMRGRG